MNWDDAVLIGSLPCHPRESGGPGQATSSVALDPRFRGGDKKGVCHVGNMASWKRRPKRHPRLPAFICGSHPSLHPLELVDEAADDAETLGPESGIGGVEAEGGQQLLVALGAAGAQHVQILLGEALLRALVDGVERVHEAVAEGVGVNVERRVDEVGDVGPEYLV